MTTYYSKLFDGFYKIYDDGIKKRAPSGFIDYFKARYFLYKAVETARKETEERIVEKLLTMKKSKKPVTKGDGICEDCGYSWIDAECACDNNEFVDRAITHIRNK